MSDVSEAERLRRIAEDQPRFGALLGMRIVVAEPDRVEAEMVVGAEFTNRNGVMHGGAIMGLADNVAGTATFLNLKDGEGTTTLESKTNFFRAVPVGSTVRAVAEPLHRGRRTMIWQTRLFLADGKLAALVIQTQMILT